MGEAWEQLELTGVALSFPLCEVCLSCAIKPALLSFFAWYFNFLILVICFRVTDRVLI